MQARSSALSCSRSFTTSEGTSITRAFLSQQSSVSLANLACNRYGLVAFGALWYAWSSYKFLQHPAKYTQSLLYVTGYSAMVIQEHLYNDEPSVRRSFDSPGLRFGFSIASLGISMAISAVFQMFVFRQPARRRLRLQLADVLFALSSYNTMLQCFVNLVAPADEAPVPRQEALAKVQHELIKRESKIQASILALAPTFQFAKVEPKWWAPFKADSALLSLFLLPYFV